MQRVMKRAMDRRGGLSTAGSRGFVLSILAAALFVTGFSATRAEAIEGAPPWSYAMAHELMSPYCPGRTLGECPSPQATTLRFWILSQAAAGATEAEVREMLNERFGDILLAAPRAEGWGLSAYVIPIAFFVIGGPVVVLIIRKLVKNGATAAAEAPAPASVVDPELERQLESELAEF